MKFLMALVGSGTGVSMLRCMSLISCLTAIALAFVGIHKATVDYSGLSLLCGTFLGAAFGGKIAQKSIESKTTPS